MEDREERDQVQHEDNTNVTTGDQETEDIPPPDPMAKLFLPILQKGYDGPVRRGNSGIEDVGVAYGVLNVTVYLRTQLNTWMFL